MELGKHLREIRVLRGLSQADIASAIGKTKGYISLIESDKRQPSLDVLEEYCATIAYPLPLLILRATHQDGLDVLTPKAASLFLSLSSALLDQDAACRTPDEDL